MEQMQFNFEYNGQTVLTAESNELARTVVITSGGASDKIPYDSEDPESPTAWVNRGAITPVTESPIPSYTRLSTDLTLSDGGYGVILDCPHHDIRITLGLVHSGNVHTVTLYSLEKEIEPNTWKRFWNAGEGSFNLSWDSSEEEEGYFAVYQGYVQDKYDSDPPLLSIGFQFLKRKRNTTIGASQTTFWQDNLFNPNPDPEHTYEPTDNNIAIGGNGNGDYPSDPAERPNVGNLNSWFAFGSSDGKGLTYYDVLVSDIYHVFSKIYSDSYINLETRLKAIIDCFRIPFTVGTGSQVARINVADVPVSVSGAYPLTQRFEEFDFPVVDLTDAGWDDYNDFSNTRATLYLPFVGRINIDINAIARGTIEVVAVGDAYTGNITYWIYTTSMNAPREVLYGVYEGQSAVQIPIASTYTPNLMGKIMAGAGIIGGGITAAVMGNPMGAAVAAGALLTTAPTALEQNVDTTHVQDSASNATSPLHIRLDISRREMIRPERYRETAGIGAFTTEVLRNLEGFVRVHSADYDGLSCEQEEKMIIKQMFEGGVYI